MADLSDSNESGHLPEGSEIQEHALILDSLRCPRTAKSFWNNALRWNVSIGRHFAFVHQHELVVVTM